MKSILLFNSLFAYILLFLSLTYQQRRVYSKSYLSLCNETIQVYDYIIIAETRYISSKLLKDIQKSNSLASIHIINDLSARSTEYYIHCSKMIYHFNDHLNPIETIDFSIFKTISSSDTIKSYIYIDISSNSMQSFYFMEHKLRFIFHSVTNQKPMISFKALRFENIYGPGMPFLNNHQLIPLLVKNSLSTLSNELVVSDNISRRYIYIDDVIHIILHSSDNNSNHNNQVMIDRASRSISTLTIAQVIANLSLITMNRSFSICFNNSNNNNNNIWNNNNSNITANTNTIINTTNAMSTNNDHELYNDGVYSNLVKTCLDLFHRYSTLQLNEDAIVEDEAIIGVYGFATPNLIRWINDKPNIQNISRFIEDLNTQNSMNSNNIDNNNNQNRKCSKNNEYIKVRKRTLIFQHVPETLDPLKALPYYYTYIQYFEDVYDICYCQSFNVMQCTHCISNISTIEGRMLPDVHFMGQSIISHLFNKITHAEDILQLQVKCRVMFLNKEYKTLTTKLEFIKKIQPNIAFTHQHDLKYFIESTGVPFARIPFAATVNDFNHYANMSSIDIPYLSDISTSGSNFHVPWRMWYNTTGKEILKQYGIHASVTGWVDSTEDYLKNIIQSKMWISSLSEGDIVAVRVFDVMATNRTLLFMNQPMDLRILRGLFNHKHIVLFTTNDDFIKKVIYYSTHENERLAIVNAAYELASNYHDWKHRADLMKSIINNC